MEIEALRNYKVQMVEQLLVALFPHFATIRGSKTSHINAIGISLIAVH